MRSIITVVLALCALVMPSTAQDELFPPIRRGDVLEFARLLDLSEEQRDAALTLFEGYAQEVARLQQDARQRMEQWQKAMQIDDPTQFDAAMFQEAVQKQTEIMFASTREQMDLEEAFFRDLALLLDQAQGERMDSVHRMRRRQMYLREAPVSWASLDLIAALRDGEIDARQTPSLDEELREYELAMDRELVKISRFVDDLMEGGAAIVSDPFSQDAQELMGSYFKHAKEIRRINKEHARRIGAMLEPQARASFEDLVRRRAFPQIFRETPTQRALAVAAGLEDLTAEQRAGIEQIRRQYERERASIDDRWMRAQDEYDDSFSFEDLMMGGGMAPGSPVFDAMNDRRALDRDFRERLEAILTPEQIERLPRDRDAFFVDGAVPSAGG